MGSEMCIRDSIYALGFFALHDLALAEMCALLVALVAFKLLLNDILVRIYIRVQMLQRP